MQGKDNAINDQTQWLTYYQQNFIPSVSLGQFESYTRDVPIQWVNHEDLDKNDVMYFYGFSDKGQEHDSIDLVSVFTKQIHFIGGQMVLQWRPCEIYIIRFFRLFLEKDPFELTSLSEYVLPISEINYEMALPATSDANLSWKLNLIWK